MCTVRCGATGAYCCPVGAGAGAGAGLGAGAGAGLGAGFGLALGYLTSPPLSHTVYRLPPDP